MIDRQLTRRLLCVALWSVSGTALFIGCVTEHPPLAKTASPSTVLTSTPATAPIDPIVARIRDEGLNRSKVRENLDYLCNVIGARLTGSPNLARANAWTRDTLASYGLSARLESWGPFGRGWSVRRFSIQVIEPSTIQLIAAPRAWSPGFDKPFEAEVVYLDAKNEAGLEKYKGKLKDRIVLAGPPRDIEALFAAPAVRMDDERLMKLATSRPAPVTLPTTDPVEPATAPASQPADELLVNRPRSSATAPTTSPSPASLLAAARFSNRMLAFAADEGAVLVIGPSAKGDGGTLFVQNALIPTDPPAGSVASRTGAATRPKVYAVDPPKIPPQVTLAIEDYNRLVRMILRGESLKMAVDMQVQFHDQDLMAYNTIAEIPGTDLKDEIVMVGAHLDSWHAGTGATDNACGSVAAMEAVRIIQALNLKPRRTIRIGLWTGEEVGLLGSTAYVKQHFGSVYEPPTTLPTSRSTSRPTSAPVVTIVKGPDYEKLSAYFNLDNGTGRIRGIYAQSNEAALPLFRQWIRPFADLSAATVTLANTSQTDHIAFDRIGLPGFQFIQDPIEYQNRTHHSNQDNFDRLQFDDLKQASTIMATFIWQAANMDERFPRKAEPPTTQAAEGRRQ